MRLVDVDEVIAEYDRIHEGEAGKARKLMENAPTVDAEPVRHGKWMVTPVYIKCSECGESFMLIPQNYCPHCGARMVEE